MQCSITIRVYAASTSWMMKTLSEFQHCEVFQVMTVSAAMFNCTNNLRTILRMSTPYYSIDLLMNFNCFLIVYLAQNHIAAYTSQSAWSAGIGGIHFQCSLPDENMSNFGRICGHGLPIDAGIQHACSNCLL
jgi:hypothetical protein